MKSKPFVILSHYHCAFSMRIQNNCIEKELCKNRYIPLFRCLFMRLKCKCLGYWNLPVWTDDIFVCSILLTMNYWHSIFVLYHCTNRQYWIFDTFRHNWAIFSCTTTSFVRRMSLRTRREETIRKWITLLTFNDELLCNYEEYAVINRTKDVTCLTLASVCAGQFPQSFQCSTLKINLGEANNLVAHRN